MNNNRRFRHRFCCCAVCALLYIAIPAGLLGLGTALGNRISEYGSTLANIYSNYGYAADEDPEIVSSRVQPVVLKTPALPASASGDEVQTVSINILATSIETDLYLCLDVSYPEPCPVDLDELDSVLSSYTVTITNSEGVSSTYTCEDQAIYLPYLDAGEYTVSGQPIEGVRTVENMPVTVSPAIAREVIPDIFSVEDVVSADSIISEVKTESSGAEVSDVSDEIETITSSAAMSQQASEISSVQQTSIPEENIFVPANLSAVLERYDYSFRTDDSGFLYFKDSDTVSTVLLIQEDVFIYGVNCISSIDDNGNTVWQQTDFIVTLVYSDGSVNDAYEVTVSEKECFEATVETVFQQGISSEETVPVSGWVSADGFTMYYTDAGTPVTGLKSIDGKLYFFDANGHQNGVVGIDVSQFNGLVDWSKVADSGIQYAIIRVGGRGWETGKLYNDTSAYLNLIGARNAGLRIGAYFYSTATSTEEAVEEASLAIENLQGLSLDLPIYFDTEFSGDYPKGRADTLTKKQQTEIARAFCDTCINSGYSSGIYSNEDYFVNCLDYSSIIQYPIWVANYNSSYTAPSNITDYSMWQCSASGVVAGIAESTDINIRWN